MSFSCKMTCKSVPRSNCFCFNEIWAEWNIDENVQIGNNYNNIFFFLNNNNRENIYIGN